MSKRTESGLTEQQERFCREYLKDLNGTQAAIRAGYAPKAACEQASRLLANAKVQAFAQVLTDERSRRTEITADYVLSKIKETVERCSQGEPHMEYNPDSKSMEPSGEWKFEHSGVLKGCELLGRHLKLFTDKVEHSGSLTLEQLVAGAAKKDEEE